MLNCANAAEKIGTDNSVESFKIKSVNSYAIQYIATESEMDFIFSSYAIQYLILIATESEMSFNYYCF